MSNSVNLALDVTKTGIQNPLIKVRQGDGGFETLHTTVTSNGEPLDLQGWTITFMGTTAGNHKIVDGNVTLVEAPNGIFDYTPSKAWGMDIGEFKIAYFKFVKGDGSASSANFRVNVIEAVDLTQDEATNYISVVDNLIEQTRQNLNNSLASASASIAATSSAADSLAVSVSDTASSAANKVNTTASSAVNTINTTASSAVSQVSSAASNASSIASSAAAKVGGVADQVNALSIGGRNLLSNTGTSLTGIGTNTANGNFNAQNVVYYLAGGKKVPDLYKQYGPSGYLTLSFDWAASGSTISGKFSPQWNTYPWEGGLSFAVNTSATNTSGHYKATVALKYSDYSNGLANGIQFRQDNLQGNITISNMKLEAGNIATDWTPAPEDVPSNDSQLVHKAGTETIAGDKTFTGNTTLTVIKSSNVKTGSVALNGLTLDFRQTIVGVNVYMHGSFAGTFGTDQSYTTSSSVIPSNIDNPKQTVVLTIVSNGGVSGITNNSPWELEVLLTASGAIQYRAKNLRDNDITARSTSIVGADSAFYTIE